MSDFIRFFFKPPEDIFGGFLWGAFLAFLMCLFLMLIAYIVGRPEWSERRYVTIYRFFKKSFYHFFSYIAEFIKDTYKLRKMYNELTRNQRARRRQAAIARFQRVSGFFIKVIGTLFSLLWRLIMGIENLFRAFLSLLWRFLRATIFQDSEETKQAIADQQLYDDVVKHFTCHTPSKEEFVVAVFGSVEELMRIPEPILNVMHKVIEDLYRPEFAQQDVPPQPDPSNEIEMQQWRDRLTNSLNVVPRDPLVALRMISRCFNEILDVIPKDGDVGLTVPLEKYVPDFKRIVSYVRSSFYPDNDDVHEKALFVELRETLYERLPLDKKGEKIWPLDYKDGGDIARVFLWGTPLLDLVKIRVPVPITEKLRFEHFHMLASSGAGKTFTMKHFLMKDFEKVVQGNASVIVIDSQSILINEISHLACLKDRLVIVDPKDVDHPVALSLFSTPKEGTPADIERAENSLIQLLSHVFMPEMTPKQSILLEAVLRLMFRIPDATIEKLYYFLQPNGEHPYQQYIAALPPMSQAFFHNEYRNDKQFRETREQLVWRLWAVLNNNTFRNMFAHPESKLNLFDEMQAAKCILINTDKDTLSDAGTELLGRYFIALIAQAAQQRVNLPEDKMTPCFVYIDEFAEYTRTASRFLENVFRQARKFKVGMFVAHHSLGDLPAETQNAIEVNTSIKFVRAVNHDDAVHMAKEMETTPEFIKAQGRGRFAVFLRDGKMKTALSVPIPAGAMEAAPKLSPDEYEAMRQANRDRYCTTQQPPPKEAAVTTFDRASDPTIPQTPAQRGDVGINMEASIVPQDPPPASVDNAPFVPSSAPKPPKGKKKPAPKKIDPDQTNIEPADW